MKKNFVLKKIYVNPATFLNFSTNLIGGKKASEKQKLDFLLKIIDNCANVYNYQRCSLLDVENKIKFIDDIHVYDVLPMTFSLIYGEKFNYLKIEIYYSRKSQEIFFKFEKDFSTKELKKLVDKISFFQFGYHLYFRDGGELIRNEEKNWAAKSSPMLNEFFLKNSKEEIEKILK